MLGVKISYYYYHVMFVTQSIISRCYAKLKVEEGDFSEEVMRILLPGMEIVA